MNIKVFQIDLSFFLLRIYKLEFILIYLICFKFSNFLHFLTQNSKKNASIFNVNSLNFSNECLKQCLFYALTSLKCNKFSIFANCIQNGTNALTSSNCFMPLEPLSKTMYWTSCLAIRPERVIHLHFVSIYLCINFAQFSTLAYSL